MKNPNEIKNKIKRQSVYGKLAHAKNFSRHKARSAREKLETKHPALKTERLEKNIVKTIDNQRDFDETFVDAEDLEVADDLQQEEIGSFLHDISRGGVAPSPANERGRRISADDEEALPSDIEDDVEQEGQVADESTGDADDILPPRAKDPKIVITSSKYGSAGTVSFCKEMASIFPNAEYVKRPPDYTIANLVKFSSNRGYTSLIIINENHKAPNALTLVMLPNGPTAYFRLNGKTVVETSRIRGKGRSSGWFPEIILNGFKTRLGCTIGKMFSQLVPPQPEFQGREVVTFHNQRDFIFFRRHRYAFRSEEKASLQELGPRFTLKLMWLQKGAFDGLEKGEYEWQRKPDMEISRRKFFL